MEATFSVGDKVVAKADVFGISAGDKLRIQGILPNGNLILAGERGSFTPDNFEPYQGAAHNPLPQFPDAADQPEAVSVTVSIDHVMREASEQGEAFANIQLSSFTAHKVLLRQVDYFYAKGESVNLMAHPEHVHAVASGFGKPTMYVYTPSKRLTNCIMDLKVFLAFLAKGGGSMMGAVAAIVQEADIMLENFSKHGNDTTLMVFQPELPEDIEDEVE